jgi:hypothetical protein
MSENVVKVVYQTPEGEIEDPETFHTFKDADDHITEKAHEWMTPGEPESLHGIVAKVNAYRGKELWFTGKLPMVTYLDLRRVMDEIGLNSGVLAYHHTQTRLKLKN